MTLPHDAPVVARQSQTESISLALAAERVRMYAAQSKAPNTKRAYASDWRHFEAWCLQADRTSLPAESESVALYLAALAEESRVSTLTRRLSAIAVVHQLAGYESPTRNSMLRAVVAGIRRSKGTAERGKRPVTAVALHAICATLPKTTTECAIALSSYSALLGHSAVPNSLALTWTTSNSSTRVSFCACVDPRLTRMAAGARSGFHTAFTRQRALCGHSGAG